MRDPAYFKLARERIKTLEKRKHHSKLSPDQLDRLANVKERIDFLEENAEMPCASLAPLNP
jgi:uncharacterized protein (DUF2384 family)